ncbi:hypothetical protein WJX79_010629 [Trebouxia sp. C0005]
MSKALESKHDKILKSLLRQPDNKRCINCETLGPQYAVSDLQIFVCTICSGVHRQFSHRVKGLSTSTFKPEEIKALEAGGNRIGAYTYLAKWSPSDLQKPTDRNTGKIKDWIDAVYVKKRFYSAEAAASAAMHSPPPSQAHLPRRSISSNASSAGDDVPVMSMAGLLGDVKLKVDPNHILSNAPNGLNLRATSTASSHSHDSPAPNHVPERQQQRAAEPAPQPPKPAPRQELPLDLFGDGLLSSYAAPPSIAGMYGQQPARPAFQALQQECPLLGPQQPLMALSDSAVILMLQEQVKRVRTIPFQG